MAGERVFSQLHYHPPKDTTSDFSKPRYIAITEIMKRYADSNQARFLHYAFWKEVVQRWYGVCRETFYSLPEPPELVSASEYGRRIGVSHVTAKDRLLKEGFIEVHRGLFSKNDNPYTEFLMQTKLPVRFIKAVNMLRTLPSDFIPTVKNLKKYLGVRGYWSVSKILGRIRLPVGRNEYLAFVSFREVKL